MSIRLVVLTVAFAAALCGDAGAGSAPSQNVAMQNAAVQTAPIRDASMPVIAAQKLKKVSVQKAPVQTARVPKDPPELKIPKEKVWVQSVSVPMDNVRLVVFKAPVSTVYVGNPSIVQLTVIDSRHVFVMGKRFGATNLIALDAEKKLIESDPVTVSSRNAEAVTVFRGEETFNYVCTDFHCETRPVPGDPKNYFDNTEGTAGEHEDTANKAAAAAAGGGSTAQVH